LKKISSCSPGIVQIYCQICFTLYLHKVTGPGQAGKLGREESDEVQQGQAQGPASGEEQPHAPVQAEGGPAGEQVCGEGPGSAGGQQVDHEPAVCSGCQEGQWDPGMH